MSKLEHVIINKNLRLILFCIIVLTGIFFIDYFSVDKGVKFIYEQF